MNKEIIKIRIDNLLNRKNHQWASFLLTVGSTISLSFNIDSLWKLLLFVLGIFIASSLFIIYFNTEVEIDKKISTLKSLTKEENANG